MKTLKYTLMSILFIGLITSSGCKNDSDAEPSETDLQLTALMNNGANWVLSSNGVIKDGFDVTDQFNGFHLNIGNKVYSTVNGLTPVWETTGVWDFQNNNPNLLIRDGVILVNVSISGGNLILTFNADAVPAGGRTESITGEYQFHLVSE